MYDGSIDKLIRAAAKTSLKQYEEASKENASEVVKKVMAQAAAAQKSKAPLELQKE